jgi:hypothetical protein
VKVRNFFSGIGSISQNKNKDDVYYLVRSISDLEIIIKHFERYPLITQKRADYELFKQVFEIISNKKHLTIEGLEKLVAIKASMNRGLSEELKANFPNIIPVPRPSVLDQKIKNPN